MNSDSIVKILENASINSNYYTSDELNSITTIVLNKMSYDGAVLETDFNDLLKFPNLYNLTLNGFIIDNRLISILLKIPGLRVLTLNNCEIIEYIYMSFSKLRLYELNLYNTNFNVSLLSNELDKLILNNVEFGRFKAHVDKLDVCRCNISNIKELLSCSFETIIVSHDLYFSNQKSFDDCKKKVIVMEKDSMFVLRKVGF